jgi:hypothetical protein
MASGALDVHLIDEIKEKAHDVLDTNPSGLRPDSDERLQFFKDCDITPEEGEAILAIVDKEVGTTLQSSSQS